MGSVFESFHSLFSSLLTRQSDGWCHSDFVFKISFLHLRIHTPSAVCLERQSWKQYKTLELKFGNIPWCFSSWCLWMKDSVSLFFIVPCMFPPPGIAISGSFANINCLIISFSFKLLLLLLFIFVHNLT